MEPLIGGQTAAAGAELIKDSDTAHFAADVIDASHDVPVIVDFWAPWCGPCKQLGPAIEKAVTAAGGRVRLVKINVDDNQALAGQLRIQSIPTVYAFKDGQPVDGFVGALPDSQIGQFVERLAGEVGPSQAEQALDHADELAKGGDHEGAAGLYGQVMQAEPDNARAIGGLIRALTAVGDLAAARAVLESLPANVAVKSEVEGARSALELAEQTGAQEGADVQALRARVEADPADHQARLDLAVALFAAGQREDAIDHLLDMVRRNRAWNEEAARKQLVKLFEAMGPTDPLTVESRRRLSSVLFA